MSAVIATAVSATVGQLMQGLDGLFTSDAERAEAKLRLQSLLLQPQILQAMTNLKAAEHPSLFVAGARPAALWICNLGLAWEFLLRPIIGSVLTIASFWGADPALMVQTAADLPRIDSAALTTLLLALLGLAGARTIEKAKGVARETL